MAIKKTTERLPPIHPGEILREEFLTPMGISINQLARDLYVPVTRISEIVNEHRGISAGTALRLARYFGMSVDFWVNLQKHYEIQVATDKAGEEIEKRVQPRLSGAVPEVSDPPGARPRSASQSQLRATRRRL
jgi:addiction module HigA family antidote